MTELLVKNTKIAKANSDTYSVYNFGLPALKTCPMAGTCATGCYAQAGAYVWPKVAAAYQWRWDQTKRPDFIAVLTAALTPKLKTAKRRGQTLVIRVHDSGDFYSAAYAEKWIAVAEAHPDVKFYAYTKMVPLARRLSWPANFTLILSEGGLADKRINTEIERHSRVFASQGALEEAGYVSASEDDLVAAFNPSPKIGLVYHGAKSKAWTTD